MLAFCDCSSLQNITIPDSVTKIGYGAFSNSVKYIGRSAFERCSLLTNINTPKNVKNI